MSQLSYSTQQLVAFAGQLGDIGPHDIGTFVNTTTVLPFGLAVSQDVSAGDGKWKLPASSADLVRSLLLGVSVATQGNENLVGTGGSYVAKSAASILKKGRIWVQVEEAVNVGDPVFVRFASGGGGTQAGAFRKSADTATAAAVSEGMKYLTSALAAGFVILEVNLP